MRRSRSRAKVTGQLVSLGLASAETILRRSQLMAAGTCSPGEYRRMVTEKMAAWEAAWRAGVGGQGVASTLAPFTKRATANARRLRRRGAKGL